MEGIWLGAGILIGVYLSFSWLIGFLYLGPSLFPLEEVVKEKIPAWSGPIAIFFFPVLLPVLIVLGMIKKNDK